MKRLILAGAAGLAALTMMQSANAADIARRQAMPTKAPAYFAPYNWSGFYVGINGGGAWGRSDFSAPFASGSFDTSGWLAGGTIGYNWQTGPVVFGLEGDIDWAHIDGSALCGGITTCEVRANWLGTARGRLGYAFDRIMPYVTGGLAVGGIKTSIAGFGDTHDTKLGWTVGGGVEAAIAGPWTAKVEYLYVDLGYPESILGSDAKVTTNIVRAGLNYRF